MFGMQVTGSESPVEYSPTPDRDISREIWSRIINNMPFFLKNKGTVRALKGLINVYGIPSTIFHFSMFSIWIYQGYKGLYFSGAFF